MSRVRVIGVVALILGPLAAGCQGTVVGGHDASPPPDHRISDGGTIRDLPQKIDTYLFPDVQTDLTATAGDPCSFGKCASSLVCLSNVCRPSCSGTCGEKAPECKGDDGCHRINAGAAACMPGSAKHLQACGGGVWCVGGYLCVKVGSSGDKCLKLCDKGACTSGFCGQSANGCNVCIE